MDLDAAACYQAILSRDARFDGRFFTAVLTTGVYCRPICPARPPRFENIRFFPCAAAAEQAGFRPCRRCRPDAAPGTPAWQGTSALVSRAVKLIVDGALDSTRVDGLAARLGVGERHLRRLFTTHLGASPLAVAQTRRLHFARKLIDETNLPMADVAFAADFSSVRRFNASIRRAFQRTPTELRRAAGPVEAESLELRLPFRPPYDWNAITGFLAPRAIPGIEHAGAGAYRRTVRLGTARGVIEVVPDLPRRQLVLRVQLDDTSRLMEAVGRARHLFDLSADPLEIAARLEDDPLVGPVVRSRPGLRVPGAWDPFETAVRAVLGQQISVAAATTLAGRLARRFGDPMPETGCAELDHLFPAPDVVASADLTTIGVTRARAETLSRLAAAVRDGDLVLDASRSIEERRASLARIPGIGPWTIEYIAMRAFAEPDAFPSSDLGLRRAASNGSGLISPAALAAMADGWRPWRAYAAIALWSGVSRDAAGAAG